MIQSIKGHLTTSFALVQAAARAVRRNPRLLAFPLLALVTGMVVLACAMAPVLLPGDLGIRAMHWAIEHEGSAVTGTLLVALLYLCPMLAGFYLLYAVASFFNVALTHAALRALAGEEVRVGEAVRVARSRLRAILGYSAIAAGVGTLIGLIQGRSRLAERVLPSIAGVGWAALALFVIPVLAREKRGGLASLRRAAALIKQTWVQGSVAVISLWFLWLPLSFLPWALISRSGVPDLPLPALVAMGLGLIALSFLPVLVQDFLSTIYGSALYVFAAEGVVPGEFDLPELATVWRVRTAAPEGLPAFPAAEGTAAPARAAVGRRLAVLTVLLAAAALTVLVWQAASALNELRRMIVPDRTGLTVDEHTFPDPFRTVWEHELPESISAVGTRGDEIVAAGYRFAYVLDQAGAVRQTFNHGLETSIQQILTADFGGNPGTSLVLCSRFGPIAAFEAGGHRLWTYDPPLGIAGLARLTVPGEGDFIALARTDPDMKGLCLLDGAGKERWCARILGPVWFVATLDCDGDGREEVLAASKGLPAYPRHQLGCYSPRGELVQNLYVPVDNILQVQARDLDGVAGSELVTWYRSALSGPLILGAWRPGGPALAELPVASTTFNFMGARILSARLQSGRRGHIAAALPNGWIVGSSLGGERWGWAAPESAVAAAAADLDGDGAEELIVASGSSVTALAWVGFSNPAACVGCPSAQ